MKSVMLLILTLTSCILAGALGFDSCKWNSYLGNPQRTGYSVCDGPDMPEILWKVEMPGAFDASPFIMDDKVLILWYNSMYHTSEAKVLFFDIVTGEVLQQFGQRRFLFSEVFPVDDKVIGLDGRRVYEIDPVQKSTTLLVEIPEESPRDSSQNNEISEGSGKPFFFAYNRYPIILEKGIVVPAIPPVCLSASDYSIVWNLEKTTSYPHLRAYDVAGDETIIVFTMATNGIPHLVAVDPSTGMLLWESDPLPLAFWLAVGEDTVYCGGKHLWAFSRDGSALWKFTPEAELVTNVVLGPDAVYAADAAHNLYKVDVNGNLVWKTDWNGSPFYQSHLIGAGDILYCIEVLGETEGSHLAAYKMEDGSKLWSVEVGSQSWVRKAPAVAGGILVIGNIDGELIALASDPDLFVEQGNAFLSKGLRNQAISSYKKAAELYEREGNTSQSQEIRERIQELENQPESPPPESTTPSTPESIMPTTPPELSTPISLSAVILIVVLIGIPFAYYLIKHKPKNG
ncbi:MAG: PQQ-binding-like beta-propeller repeat protein [Theionarchaea archaeon]|nr:PQQ-binding-like beta-propeller repeat protein [Theionarchaea archaeon]